MNGDAQVAERFHPPQEIADEYNVVHLRDVFICHALDAECVDAEHRQDNGQYRQTLPHLLVLKVGIVVA